ncbi:MAG: isoleucine--tRNA ligase, partial [Gammaproteobacteria bacterium]|nr:isoleucine--tRNA ligase [Gammaproteobacteria bacterium]
DMILELREAVDKELERLRVEGKIGSPLDADVTVYCSDPQLGALRALGDELRFILITSAARVESADAKPADAVEASTTFDLTVAPTTAEKCARCWHRRADVGTIAEHPGLCARCVGNVEGPGEQRKFA